jgi:hypothetical protein
MFALIPTDAREPRTGYRIDVRTDAFSLQLFLPSRWSRMAVIEAEALNRIIAVESPAAANDTGARRFQPGNVGRQVVRLER